MVRKATKKFVTWCAEDSAEARLERTILQGIIGVAGGALGILLSGEGIVGLIIAPVVMAILSPLQAKIGESNMENTNDQ